MTKAEQNQIEMYGMTKMELDDMIANSIYREIGKLEMLAMSMMSDAQELVNFCQNSRALNDQRQILNCAKYVLSVVMKEKVEA
jgi:hypothetical protein